LKEITQDDKKINEVKLRTCQDTFILSTQELSGLVHLPTTHVQTPNINWVLSRNFEPPINLPILSQVTPEIENDLTPI